MHPVSSLYLFVMTMSFAVPSAGQSRESADDVIASCLEARERVQSGEFSAICRQEIERVSGGRIVLETSVFCVFHRPSGSLHFRRTGDISIAINDSAELTEEVLQEIKKREFVPQATLQKFDAVVVRNPEYMTNWIGYGARDAAVPVRRNLEIREPDAPILVPGLRPFDPSGAGMYLVQELDAGLSAGSLLQRWRDRSDDSSVRVRPDGLLDLVLASPHSVRTFTVDPDAGWSCVQMTAIEPDKQGETQKLAQAKGDARWIKRGGQFVPDRFATQLTMRSGKTSSYDYRLTWTRVNEVEATDRAFRYESIEGIWPGVTVYERRNGQTVALSVVGEDSILASGLDQGRTENSVNALTAQKGTPWLLYLNAALAALAVGYWFWRRMKV